MPDGHADPGRAGSPVSHGDDAPFPPLNATLEQFGVPFVVQAGRKLFMLASESSQWVLAELTFDTASCTFMEASRVRYDWPREAFGSLLAKVAVGDDIDHDLIDRLTTDFSRWLASQFVVR